jgi:hypothetical protein
VLIEVAHAVESKKQVPLNSSGIAPVIGLKRVNDSDRLRRYSCSLPIETLGVVGSIFILNRKLGLLGSGDGQAGERIHKLVQSRTQAVEKIPNDQRNRIRSIADIDFDAMASCLKIVFTTN